MSGHSDIGASSAYRWIACPGSVALSAGLPRKSSIYAATGTAAHEVCERCLLTGKDPGEFVDTMIEADGFEVTVDDAMVAACKVYVDKVREDLVAFGGELAIETSFDLSWLYPGMYGRNDAALLPREVFGDLHVYDYKNGRKKVEVERNPQLMYYALGALGEGNPYLAENVVVNIVQPNAFGGSPVSSWSVSVEELYAWGREVLAPAAAATKEPGAPLRPGDHCTFCPALANCPARREEALAMLGLDDIEDDIVLPDVRALSPAQVGRASEFFTSEAFTSWAKSLAEEELSMLQRGLDIPGRKLVEKTVLGNRKWRDENDVIQSLKGTLGEELFVSKVKSPAQVDKALTSLGMKKKEREEALEDLTVREESVKVAVVSEGHPSTSIKEQKQKALEML